MNALGKGLGSLIPGAGNSAPKQTYTERVIPEAHHAVLDIEVKKITPNPRQPRKHFSPTELEDLMGSIKEHGILQPITVTTKGGGYELVAGERRLRASTALGRETIPAIVREITEQQKLELALIENIQRHDLNAVEEAYAFKALLDEFNLTQEEVAKRVGKSRSAVANTIRLLDLDEEILDAIMLRKISKSHARTLLSETDRARRLELFYAMLEGKMSVRQAEGKTAGSRAKRAGKEKDPNIAAHEAKLREIFGTRVEIQEQGGKGKLSIHFYSKAELGDLLDRMADL
jgi:ParB family transcriptional regulator, chromosome partitioning protein